MDVKNSEIMDIDDEPVFNYQCWICPKCFDDHGRDNHERCADNLLDDFKKSKRLLKEAIRFVEYAERDRYPGTQFSTFLKRKDIAKYRGTRG